MSKRLDVITAVLALIKVALPQAEVLGLGGDDAPPARIGPYGRAIVRSGDPGAPEIDLSPVAYHYAHRIPVELVFPPAAGVLSERTVTLALGQIAPLIEADRTLGGLCDYLEATAPTTGDVFAEGTGRPPRGAVFDIIASYSTSSPI